MMVPSAAGLFGPLHLTFKSYFLPASSLPPSIAGCFPVPPGPWGSYMRGRETLALSPAESSARPAPDHTCHSPAQDRRYHGEGPWTEFRQDVQIQSADSGPISVTSDPD